MTSGIKLALLNFKAFAKQSKSSLRTLDSSCFFRDDSKLDFSDIFVKTTKDKSQIIPSVHKYRVFVWHVEYGVVECTTIQDGFELGHALNHTVAEDLECDDRHSMRHATHVGIYSYNESDIGKDDKFFVHSFDIKAHKQWLKKNVLSDFDPRWKINFKE